MTRMRLSVLGCVAALGAAAPALARPGMSIGPRTFRGSSNLSVGSATDYAGADVTDAQDALPWESHESSMVIRYEIEVRDNVTAFAELGWASVDLTYEESGNQTDYAFTDGVAYGFGAATGGEVPNKPGLLWSAGLSLRGIGWADYHTAGGGGTQNDLDYSQFTISLDATIGKEIKGSRVYGGFRLSWLDGEFSQEREWPSVATRETNFDREGMIDVVAGVEMESEGGAAFVELSVPATFGVAAGVRFRF